MNEEFIVFGQPRLSDEHIEEVVSCLKSGWIGRGPRVSKFESMMAEYLGVPYCAALSSCTAALHLSILAADIQPGDEVLVPAMTFGATANSVFHAGAKPVFVDCNKNNPCMDVKDLETKITPRSKAIIVVHMHGERADMKEIVRISKKYNLKIIEDAAHALELKGLAKESTFACFSFYPNKNITTIEGGLVASHDKGLIDQIKIRAQHGLSSDAWKRFSDDGYKHYLIETLGFKYNMTDVQASIGIHEIPRISVYREKRKKLWAYYIDSLKDTGLDLPPSDVSDHAMYVFAPRISAEKFTINRDQFITALHEEKVGTGVHYLSLCEHPFYQRELGLNADSCKNALKYGRETISIPFSQHLKDSQVERVCSAIKKVLKNNRR